MADLKGHEIYVRCSGGIGSADGQRAAFPSVWNQQRGSGAREREGGRE